MWYQLRYVLLHMSCLLKNCLFDLSARMTFSRSKIMTSYFDLQKKYLNTNKKLWPFKVRCWPRGCKFWNAHTLSLEGRDSFKVWFCVSKQMCEIFFIKIWVGAFQLYKNLWLWSNGPTHLPSRKKLQCILQLRLWKGMIHSTCFTSIPMYLWGAPGKFKPATTLTF